MEKTLRFTFLFLHNPHKISPQPYYTENLGIQYVGAVLRKAGFEVQIINADYQNLGKEQITNLIRSHNSNFVGMAPCYVTISEALDIARVMKKDQPRLWVCLGGHHATFCADDILKNEDCVDFVVRGEGDRTILELARAVELDNEGVVDLDSLLSIDGLSFRFGEDVFHNRPRALIEDLDSVPFPLRDPLDGVLREGQHAMPLLCTSRGCPANCGFCSTPRFYGQVWRARSAKNVVDEVQEIVENYGFTQFYVTDDQFAGVGERGRNHVKTLIGEIKRRQLHERFNLHFFLMVRADFFRKRNEDIIRQFPEVGFRDIFIGFESGDPSKLKLYSKGATLGQYQEAIDLLHKYDLFVEGGFIIFSPYATFDSLRQDALFIRRLGVPLFGYHTKELMAFPGTRLFEELVQDGLMVHHSYEKIEFRYRDRRVGDFYHYLQDFFARFEDRDNQLFQVIDFEIKLASSIGRIEDQRIKQEAREFIRQARTTYTKISELNFHFFSAVADVFEQGENAHALRVRRGQFETEHQSLVAPIIRDYHALNMKTGIIQPRLHLLREG